MFSHKRVEKVLPGEQRMLAIGNHQRRRDLHRIGVKFGTLMAKQRQNGRYAKLQQGEKGDIQFRYIPQLHQSGFARFDALTA
ncbi:Uncharacterised protein [Salmonella enterica subsp. enterica serovar Bovismorbificans]|nr:Uncharacterised protein [Salmonella enterica subsp. enterica serovar Bovismorbificans]